MTRVMSTIVAAALAAALVVFLSTLLADHASQSLSARAAALATDSLSLRFTLPSHEALGCSEANAPCTDLDSVFLYRQDRYRPAAVSQRARVRGQEGQLFAFRVPAALQAVYYVTTKDIAGNEACGSNLIQVAGSVGVPIAPVASERIAAVYDLAGRRLTRPFGPGVYFERVTGQAGIRRVVVLR